MDNDIDRPLGPAERYVFTAIMMIFAITGIVCVGGIIYGVITNLKESAMFLAGLSVFALIVHVIVKKVDWDA